MRYFWISLTTLFILPCWAKPQLAVEQARLKMLEKDRAAAVEILLAAINSAAPKSKTQPQQLELIKELQKLSTIFISNEGQRIFELAESIRFSGQMSFAQKYDEAFKIEPGNVQILLSSAIGLLSLKNCKKAQEQVVEIEKSNPYLPELPYVKYRVQTCLDPAGLTNELESGLSDMKDHLVYKKAARAEKSFLLGHTEAGLDLAHEIILMDAGYPMGYYWAWKIQRKEEDLRPEEAQKYLSLCKGVGSDLRRKYNLEPNLCVDQDEAEEYLKKIEGLKQ